MWMDECISVWLCSLCWSGWPQSRRYKSWSFPGFSRAIILRFRRPSQQTVNVTMTFINGSEIVVIMFTQSTAVLHEYLNDELKLLSCYNFFPRLHRIPWVFCFQRNFRALQIFQVCSHPGLCRQGDGVVTVHIHGESEGPLLHLWSVSTVNWCDVCRCGRIDAVDWWWSQLN